MNNKCVEVVFELLQEHTSKGYGKVSRDFWRALSDLSLENGEAQEALLLIEQQRRIDFIYQGEGEHPLIIVRPPRTRCPDCRQWHSGYEDWDDHIDACQEQQEKLRERGLLYPSKIPEPKGGRHV